VVGNLLQNAVKFTQRGGRVRLELGRHPEEEDTALLRVCDDGRGIEAHMLARVFEPFAQADLTLDRSSGGLGLGLSLVKGIVDMHGGTVSATSAGPKKGAEFLVRLPLGPGRVEAAASAPRQDASPQPHRVLVVEDNEDAADSLREILELDAHTVEVAGSGPEGLEKARRFAPDVILCDLGLPGMDGYEVASAIRADPVLRATYLVALSGYAAPEHLATARTAGFDYHLAKPADMGQISRIIRCRPSFAAEVAEGVRPTLRGA
jgi:two-component system CheB/CheR fusion protein